MKEKLIQLMYDNFDLPQSYDEYGNFIEDGYIDSFSLRELCLLIKSELDISLEDYEIITYQLFTIASLVNELENRS